MTQERVAVVLFQLGGPDSTGAVEPFLYNLFCDPDIIDFPGAFLARKPLARFIARRRSGKVAEHYREIGGKSPILELTLAQAGALAGALAGRVPADVFVAMRYWAPFTGEAVRAVREGGYRRTVLLPLYPHYSRATTGSSLREWRAQARKAGLETAETTVCCFHNHPEFIRAIAGRVDEALGAFEGVPPAEIDLVFSAHGIPVSLVESGDPYKMQIEETVRLVKLAGRWASPSRLCYQSKVGPAEWLGPSLDETVRGLAAAGRKNLLIVPVAFVTDHIETLHEINIETRAEALKLGVTRFGMTAGLNSSPAFIACLADLTLAVLGGTPVGTETCRGVCARTAQEHLPRGCPHWTRADDLRR